MAQGIDTPLWIYIIETRIAISTDSPHMFSPISLILRNAPLRGGLCKVFTGYYSLLLSLNTGTLAEGGGEGGFPQELIFLGGVAKTFSQQRAHLLGWQSLTFPDYVF